MFSDTFPSTTYNASDWTTFDSTIDSVGSSEPSASYSARFNGNPDELLTLDDLDGTWSDSALAASDASLADGDGAESTAFAAAGTVLFDAMTSPLGAASSGSGPLGYDDYNTTLGAGTSLSVEKVTIYVTWDTIGGLVEFVFYDADLNPVGSRDVYPSAVGTYTYSLNISTPITVPDIGFMLVYANAPTTGRWWVGTDAPAVGSEDRSAGTAAPNYSYRFALTGTEAPDEHDLYDRGATYSNFTPTTVVAGDAWSVNCDVRNGGTASAGGFYVDYYASADATISTSD